MLSLKTAMTSPIEKYTGFSGLIKSYLREIMACSDVREISIYDGPNSLPVLFADF